MSNRTDKAAMAQQTLKISQDREYKYNQQIIRLKPLEQPQIFTEEMLEALANQKQQPKPMENVVINSCSINAALGYAPKRIVILNFASDKKPGGGFLTGAQAQEEQLCRCSDLYSSLVQCQKEYYTYNHSQKDMTNTERIIVSNNTIFRRSNFSLIHEPVDVTFVTCAAVRSHLVQDKEKVSRLMKARITNVMNVVNSLNADVAILGAFGCGVFKNDPKLVAKCFKSEISQGKGALINCFAIFGEGDNIDAFRTEFK
ncbi:Conserved_hypothetical protein [Hexamita inflata]|uniref:Microbial-type PARG catalytic domain-containing protein n=1 Tax=Hexamita inflata TaxID=28002 RepID=A0AA86NH03_9EUKA|nr:Conserved hypothetical protein [Hexamita inflata]